MNRKILIIIFIGMLSLSGCFSSDTSKTNEENNESVKNISKASNQRDQNKDIEVLVEGDTELRSAKLMYNDSEDYSMYVLDDFTFSAEEPNRDILFWDRDGEFFVRIEKLDNRIDIDTLNKGFTNAYSKLGNVVKNNPKSLNFDEFKDAKSWVHADISKSENIKVQKSIEYIIKEIDGQLYAFTLHFPLKEAAEGITPSIWAMIITMEGN